MESHPEQKPKLETVEALANALGWPIQEARRLAGYSESDDNLTPLEVEDNDVMSQYEEADSDGIPEIELDDLDELIEEQKGETKIKKPPGKAGRRVEN